MSKEVIATKNVTIIEVCPRDGFQNVKEFIPTDIKKTVIDGMIRSGLKHIQITSFVSPKIIPQMIDAKEIATYCVGNYPNITFHALVPNLRGAASAAECEIKHISYIISVSETHNLKNVKKTREESFADLQDLIGSYPNLDITLDVVTAFGCFYEGYFGVEEIMKFLRQAYDLGIRSFNLCDTVGMAYPSLVEDIVGAALSGYTDCEFQIHIHDTRNMGILNTYTALKMGITKLQTSLGGLGGCPFAPGASGNTSTEDMVYLLNKMGYKTSIDFDILLYTAKNLKACVNGSYSGHQIFIETSNMCNH